MCSSAYSVAYILFTILHFVLGNSGSSGGSGSSSSTHGSGFVEGHQFVAYGSPDPLDAYHCREIPWPYTGQRNASAEMACTEVCPTSKLIDYHQKCSQSGHHMSNIHLFEQAQTMHSNRQYVIFALSFYAILGALCKMSFPKSLPYTVGLLLISFLIGFVSNCFHEANDCPMHALRHSGHDGVVTESEWDAFTCASCNPQSFCAQHSCAKGNLSADCRWSFDDLWQPRRIHSMDPERQNLQTYGDQGSRVLTADNLWRPECNLFRDLFMPLAGMDPHVILVVFLPVLLFESAFFGIDVRFARY